MQQKIKKEICTKWMEIDKFSKELCHDNCGWYHGSWCLLRCLDLVVGPFIFEEFYRKSIEKLTLENIGIVGTAGLSMPYFISQLHPNSKVDIIDICPTPLKVCELYAKEHDLKWNLIQKNMLKASDIEEKYDLIVNDSFLTLFTHENKMKILKNIYDSLSVNGYYVTTLRKSFSELEIHQNDKETQDIFVKKALVSSQEERSELKDEIKEKARKYSSRMTNYPMYREEDVRLFFENVGFTIINLSIKRVLSEAQEVDYFEIVVQKRGE